MTIRAGFIGCDYSNKVSFCAEISFIINSIISDFVNLPPIYSKKII